MQKNIGGMDRMARAILGGVFLLGAVFWVGGLAQWMFFVLAVVFMTTAVFGFCPLYTLFSLKTLSQKGSANKGRALVFVLALVGALFGGGYASIFLTKKFFIEDFNVMNNAYKQTLFNTGQNNRAESMENYEALVLELSRFQRAYNAYHPWAIRNDRQFNVDIEKVSEIVGGLRETIFFGDLYTAHLALETVRPITQDILKRNNFSLLAVSLVDFHDAMENVITPAESKDARGVISAYAEANEKLIAVEQEANDAEIQNIRKNLEAVFESAKRGDAEALPEQSALLKSSFVKVYLVRG